MTVDISRAPIDKLSVNGRKRSIFEARRKLSRRPAPTSSCGFTYSWKANNIPLRDQLVACHGCDLLVDVSGLLNGSRAACPCCGQLLTRSSRDAISRVLAQAIAAAILVALANSFSFLSFSIGELESSMALHQAAPGALWDSGMPGLPIMAAAFIIVFPAIFCRCSPWSARRYCSAAARLLFALQHWVLPDFSRGIAASLRSLC